MKLITTNEMKRRISYFGFRNETRAKMQLGKNNLCLFLIFKIFLLLFFVGGTSMVHGQDSIVIYYLPVDMLSKANISKSMIDDRVEPYIITDPTLVRKITNVVADSPGVKKSRKEKKNLFYDSRILVRWFDKGIVSKEFVVYQGGQYCTIDESQYSIGDLRSFYRFMTKYLIPSTRRQKSLYIIP